jgi:hypothetical protein
MLEKGNLKHLLQVIPCKYSGEKLIRIEVISYSGINIELSNTYTTYKPIHAIDN